MDEILEKVQNNLNERDSLLEEAKLLEERANSLRNKVKNNDLGLEIKSIQKEILHISKRYELLQELISLATRLFDTGVEPIPISLTDYQSCCFQGKSIESIEQELTSITSRIKFLCDILSKICGYVGHDYRFVETTSVFDFNSLELSLEERHIYYCAICGEAIALEDKNELVNEEADELLKKLRKAKKISLYQSNFRIVDTLDNDFQEKAR